MSITRNNPNTIFLGGDRTQINDLAASEAITPGHLIDRFNNGGIIRWRKHATSGQTLGTPAAVATEMAMLNKGVDDAYAAGDLVEASVLHKGAFAWMLIASGQNIVAGNRLESAGDGTLKILSTGQALFQALENKPTVTSLTRIRVEAI
jgi:hypothetical protein